MNRNLRSALILTFVMSVLVCFGQPCGDPAPCVECNSSPDCILCDISVLDGYCYTLPNENQVSNFPGCPNNVLNNDRWFGFIADAFFVSIEITASNCEGQQFGIGVHGGLYGGCNGEVVDVQCECINGAFILQGAVNPGQLYWIVMDGCDGDICDIGVVVLEGAGDFEIPDPETINGIEPNSGDSIEVCWGYEDFPFFGEDLFGAQEYHWVMPDGELVITGGPTSPGFDFIDQGAFEVCVSALHFCDTTEQICVPIKVYPLPPDTIFVEICENDPCVEFDDGDCHDVAGFYDAQVRDNNGCYFDRTMVLDVFPEDDTLVYDVICFEDLPFDLPDGMVTYDAGTYNSQIPSALGCDSTVITELSVLGGEILMGEIECNQGVFTVVANLDLLPYVTSFEAEWQNEDDDVVSDTLSLSVSEEGEYTLYVTVMGTDLDDSIDYNCELEPFTIEIDSSLFFPGTPEDIFGTFVFCDLGQADYLSDTIDDADSYLWDLPPGAEFLTNPDSIWISIDLANAVTGLLCVRGVNDCGMGPEFCREISIIDEIEADAGPNILNCGDEYEMQAELQGSGGLWTLLDGPGTAEFSDLSSPTTSVTVDPLGIYTFELLDSAGICNDRDTVEISFLEEPSWDSIATFECDGVSEFYTIQFEIQGGQDPYTIVNGGGQIDGNIYTSDLITSDSSYYIEIVDLFNCGPVIVAGNHACVCLTEIGEMSEDTLNACAGESVTAEYFSDGEFMDDNDTCNYILHELNGDSVGVIWSVSTDPDFDFVIGMIEEQVYYISKVIGNLINDSEVDLEHGCTQVAPGQPVIWRAAPFALAGMDTAICEFVFDFEAVPSIGAGAWDFISGPSVAIITDVNDPTSEVSVFEYGQYEFVWTEQYFDCVSMDTLIIDILDYPTIDQNSIEIACNDTMTAYTVSFDVINGDPNSYMVTGQIGGSLVGNHFESNPIPSGSVYEFTISDGFACELTILIDSFTCPCISQTGIMSMDTLLLCEDELAIASYDDTDQVFDANDGLYFVLHSGNAESLEGIIATNEQPSFGFVNGPMNYGQVYYISAVVGDDTGLFIDTLNTCHIVSFGQPVVFYEIPNVIIDPSATIITCEISSIELDASLSTPQGILEYIWKAEDGGEIIGDPTQETITINKPGTYILEVHNGACVRQNSIEIDISEDIPLAEAGEGDTLTCLVLDILLDGSQSDSGQEFEYFWVNADNDTIGTGITQMVSTPGIYTLVITNTENGCIAVDQVAVGIDTVSSEIVLNSIGVLTCSQTTAFIDATGSDEGGNYSSIWTTYDGNIISDPSENIIQVNRAGIYLLTIENSENGCITTQEFELVELTNTLTGIIEMSSDVSCFGEDDGMISVLDIQGGVEPLQISIDGGASFTDQFDFDGLGPGTYGLVIRDSLGCEFAQEVLIVEPPLVDVLIDGDVEILIGENGILTAIHNIPPQDIDTIIWTSMAGNEFLCQGPNCQTIVITPDQSDVFSVTVISENGCADTDFFNVAVLVSRNVYIPNVFSPNTDGLNDFLAVYAQKNAKRVLLFEVYDRWGQLVYRAENFPHNNPDGFGWDGTFKGERLNHAVFTYYAQVEFKDGFIVEAKGDVLLVD